MNGSEDADAETLRVALAEARRTLDAQLDTLDDIDEKAVTVFRLDIALSGLLVSALSFVAESDAAAATTLSNPAMGAGVGLFVLSAAAAGLTYTAAGQQVGAGPAGLRAAGDRSERAVLAWLVDSYAAWIETNERTNVRKALLVTLSLVGTVAGALAVTVGALAAFTGLFAGPAVVAAVVLFVLAGLVGLPSQIGRLLGDGPDRPGAVAPQSLDEPMAGQRTFKGRDRDG